MSTRIITVEIEIMQPTFGDEDVVLERMQEFLSGPIPDAQSVKIIDVREN